jgi:hypothetical protein
MRLQMSAQQIHRFKRRSVGGEGRRKQDREIGESRMVWKWDRKGSSQDDSLKEGEWSEESCLWFVDVRTTSLACRDGRVELCWCLEEHVEIKALRVQSKR